MPQLEIWILRIHVFHLALGSLVLSCTATLMATWNHSRTSGGERWDTLNLLPQCDIVAVSEPTTTTTRPSTCSPSGQKERFLEPFEVLSVPNFDRNDPNDDGANSRLVCRDERPETFHLANLSAPKWFEHRVLRRLSGISIGRIRTYAYLAGTLYEKQLHFRHIRFPRRMQRLSRYFEACCQIFQLLKMATKSREHGTPFEEALPEARDPWTLSNYDNTSDALRDEDRLTYWGPDRRELKLPLPAGWKPLDSNKDVTFTISFRTIIATTSWLLKKFRQSDHEGGFYVFGSHLASMDLRPECASFKKAIRVDSRSSSGAQAVR
ncbi:hypothetical protein B0T20DRAFT_388417 [Sordaria brevicollis]|uniref:Uncharacterized protein n=1 Tax=Sordaria brevicollis TaxID=83679 RepID=A0AAE0PML2_SORBR|nr:hypothetical protein B0T20DRAFT_388417 [Sordaria brevicollis]